MNIKVILVISLFSNVLLAGYALRPQPATPPAAEASTKNAITASAPTPKLDKQTITNTITKRITWEMVESGDYKEYIANLRSIGCPEETIRDIIIADVNKLYDRKKKEVRGDPKKFEFWKSGNPFMSAMDSELMKKLGILDEEKNAVLRALGITPDAKTEMAQVLNPFESMMDFLPEEKKTRVIKLMSDMQSKMMEASKDGADTEAMGKAMQDMETALKGVLTPQEYLDYQLRFSMTANMLRNQVAGFDPNEEEFMRVFKLREPFDSEFSPMTRGNESDDQRKSREAAEKKLKEDIKALIGAGALRRLRTGAGLELSTDLPGHEEGQSGYCRGDQSV
ncbi:MAG: hypothetical protein ACO1QS_00100 [Verrucomicrobiota bacterium]